MSTSNDIWKLQTVRSFWQAVNWENRPLVVKETSSNGQVATATALSFTLSVQQYFDAIAWSGVPIVAPLTTPTVVAELEEPAETLDDFLDDISRFF